MTKKQITKINRGSEVKAKKIVFVYADRSLLRFVEQRRVMFEQERKNTSNIESVRGNLGFMRNFK